MKIKSCSDDMRTVWTFQVWNIRKTNRPIKMVVILSKSESFETRLFIVFMADETKDLFRVLI